MLVLLEVIFVYIAFGIIFRWLAFATNDLGWHYMVRNMIYAAWAVSIPLLLIWLTKTNVGFNTWKVGLHGGFLVFWIGFVQSAGFATVAELGMDFSSVPAFFLLVEVVLIMIVCALLSLKNFDSEKQYPYKWKLIFFLALYLIPPIVVAVADKPVGKTIFFELYFTIGVGFAEEVLYRGYIQIRLNNFFGRNWKIGSLQFGPGLIIASILFGLGHIYQLGSTEPNIMFGLAAIFAGLFFGIVRERAGIWAAIIFHVIWSAIPEPIMIAFGVM